MGTWKSFVAIGDSFTEGLDDWRPDGTPRGWADRVAERLAEDEPELRYANLAVRGKLLDQIVTDQVPVAERLRPDLIASRPAATTSSGSPATPTTWPAASTRPSAG